MKKLIIAITGTPATGKTSFAKTVKRYLKGIDVIEINDIVNERNLYSGVDKFNTKIVRLVALKGELKKIIKSTRGRAVVLVGHLAPELGIRYDAAIVLRCSLGTLARRMEKRGYAKEKIRDNLIAEAVDYCGATMEKRCTAVYEAETRKERERAVSMIKLLLDGKNVRVKKREIDKIGDLLKLVNKGNRYGL
jgi:adenylate kinase